MELVFVRHGQPGWERERRAVDEPGLTELGRAQAERVAAHLAAEPSFDAAYVSPLRRARETAEPIERRLAQHCHVQSWLAELRMPELAGTPIEAVERFFAEARAREPEKWWDGVPGGESFRHFRERVGGGLEALLESDHDARVHPEGAGRLWRIPAVDRRLLLVAHAGSIAVSLAHLLGIEQVPWAVERFALGFAGIVQVQTRAVGGGWVWSLTRFNDRRHLAGLAEIEF